MKEELTFNINLSPVALKIRTLRIHKGISQKELAKLCGLSLEQIISYETDKDSPSSYTEEMIMEVLTG